MNIKHPITSFLILLTSISYSQDFMIRKKKLTTINIDTVNTKIFIYGLQKVNIYFKQQDISDFILNPKNKNIIGQGSYKELLDTLNTSTRVIRIRNIPDYTNDFEFDSLLRVYGDSIKLQKLNSQFYIIGAALMLNGNFMIYKIEQKSFLTKGLFAKTQKEALGQKTLNFYISKKQKYYFIITELGE